MLLAITIHLIYTQALYDFCVATLQGSSHSNGHVTGKQTEERFSNLRDRSRSQGQFHLTPNSGGDVKFPMKRLFQTQANTTKGFSQMQRSSYMRQNVKDQLRIIAGFYVRLKGGRRFCPCKDKLKHKSLIKKKNKGSGCVMAVHACGFSTLAAALRIINWRSVWAT